MQVMDIKRVNKFTKIANNMTEYIGTNNVNKCLAITTQQIIKVKKIKSTMQQSIPFKQKQL